jgi:two-component system, OmpR family, KDP operon response regulator KdpE
MTGGILVVDDEPGIRRLVSTVLARGGFVAHEAPDARSALALADRAPDAAIVDLGLPDRDGLELVAAFAARGIPTLVLSARLDTVEKIAALDLGADDYLTKPFDGDELLARLRVVLRRSRRRDDGVVAHGPFRVEPAFHHATLNERPLDLTPREFALLAALVAGEGRVLTHRVLLTQVWGPAHAQDLEYLRVAIRSLRRKVESKPAEPTLIINEPGVGYRIASPAQRA